MASKPMRVEGVFNVIHPIILFFSLHVSHLMNIQKV